MKWIRNSKTAAKSLLILTAFFVFAISVCADDQTIPSSVDVYWQSTRTIAAPGVTNIVVLDTEIAGAQIGNETIEFAGLSRGQTVALAYVKGAPVSIVIHVIDRPVKVIPPSLLRRQAEMAHGSFGSDFQMSNSGGSSTYILVDSFSWMQEVGDTRFSAVSSFEDNSQFAGHNVNLRSGSVAYHTPSFTLDLVDFSQSLTGELGEDRVNTFSSGASAGLRGADLILDHGKNEFSLFGGTTIPYYFLSLNATRDVAGFTFHRRQSSRLSMFGGTSYVNVPLTLTAGVQRRTYVMQTAGLSYKLARNFIVGATGGYSNGGNLGRGDLSYTSLRFSGYATAIFASQTFPLNQIQSLFSGTSTIKSGFTYRATSRLNPGFYYEHTDISPGLIYKFSGSSDYVSPNLGLLIARGETLNAAYTYSRSNGGFTTASSTGHRYDISLSSQLPGHITNGAQVSVGSIQDPLQINSEDRFTVRDSLSIPIKGQTLQLGVEQDRVQPSLVSKLNQELSLLSPVLQAEFLANPAAFVDSTNFPPEVKALLAAEQPTGTTISAGGILVLGSKLRLNPTFSVTHDASGSQADSWTQAAGYSLVYQFRPTLQFRSSLSNVFLYNTLQNSTVRTMVLSFGFQKNFSAVPASAPFVHHGRLIEGRVFRDTNVNGAFNVGEPGLAGIQVSLDDGEIATTDELGRYKFSSVSADQHEVSIALRQFNHPVRMTTSSELTADLIQSRIAVLNFGILDFARVMGSVYNDLRFDNRRQPDSKGMQSIELLLDNGKDVRKIETDGSGEFELDDVSPGDYRLSINAASVPPNYTTPIESVPIHVSPVSTVVQDVPMRALRSISGRVLLKNDVTAAGAGTSSRRKRNVPGQSSGPESTLEPVPGVEIVAGSVTATTDKDGNFLLRNLPAGILNVTIRAVKDVPQGINIPSGQVKLPAEPIQIQGATIVITNKDLLPYLTRTFPGMPADTATVARKITQPPLETKPISAPVTTTAVAPTSPTAAAPIPPTPASASPVPAQVHTAAASASVVPPTAAAPASAASTVANPMPSGDSVLWTLTRADCEKLPSLGEVAQCFRQLKQATASQK